VKSVEFDYFILLIKDVQLKIKIHNKKRLNIIYLKIKKLIT